MRNGLAFDDDRREEITRDVLNAPIELSHKRLGMQLGINRTLVRQIRYGLAYTDVLPDLMRLEPDQPRRRCDQCVQWEPEFTRSRGEDGSDIRQLGHCSLGIPEAENMRYGRGCGAFVKAQP